MREKKKCSSLIDVKSEYGVLEAIMVHEPGGEIERILPSNKNDLLFDDIPFLRAMKEEHKRFVHKLNKETDCEVFYLENLLLDLVNDSKLRKDLIKEIIVGERYLGLREYLENLDDKEIVEKIFCGISAEEWARHNEKWRRRSLSEFVMTPIPNAYFMRDPAAVVGKGIICCKMQFSARIRESIVLKHIFAHHKYFKGNGGFFYGRNPSEDRPYTVEGGDIMVINEHAVAIGWSQRTAPESIEKIAENLFNNCKEIERVYEVKIPPSRAYMHLDTVCTIIGPGTIVLYPDVLNKEIVETSFYTPTGLFGKRIPFFHSESRNFIDCLKEEFYSLKIHPLKIIQTGDGNPLDAEREQWADGSNVFAIGPDKVITYDRNEQTNKALREKDVEVIEISGSELVRGRGGPRCMSLPLRRRHE